MKQLIISDYDIGTDFTFIIIENGKEVRRSKNEDELMEWGLYREDWCFFDKGLLSDKNLLVKEFDLIVVCADGEIEIYYPKEDKNE